MDYEANFQKISKIEARTDDRLKFMVDTLLHRRCDEQNAAFIWSKENVQKLLAMNEALMELSHRGLEALERVYWDLKRMLDSGKKDYATFCVDVSFSYEGEWSDSEYFTEYFLCDLDDRIGFRANDEQADFSHPKKMLFDMNWNVCGYSFRDRPEFADQHVCYLMYKFFSDGTYSFQDALKMNPDDFCYFIKISI